MTDDVNVNNSVTSELNERSRPRPLMVIGSVMWVLCFIGIICLWYQQRYRVHAVKSQSSQVTAESDDGRSSRQIELVLQPDGSFAAQDFKKEDELNPWDVEGIEDFSFTDTEVKTWTKQDLLGKPFVISFIFTHCRGPCPNVTLQMRELQDRLADYDFNLVTLTVDPDRDTPEILKRYGKENGANFDRWRYLTGNSVDIYGLIQRSFKVAVEEVKGPDRIPGFEIIHSTNIMLVDAMGRVIGKYNAQKDDEMAKLRKDLKRVAKLKSNTNDNQQQDGKQ